MTLFDLSQLDAQFGYNYKSFASLSGKGLYDAILELQGLRVAILSGQVNAGVAMTLSGIDTTDTILSAINFPLTAGAVVDRTASCQVTTSGVVTCNESLATTSYLLVLWAKKYGKTVR